MSNDFELGKKFGATAEQMRFASGLLAHTYHGDDAKINACILSDLCRCFPSGSFALPGAAADEAPPKARK